MTTKASPPSFRPSLFFVGTCLLVALSLEHLAIAVPALQTPTVAGALALSLLAAAIWWGKPLKRLLGTVRTSVVLLGIFGAACVAGSMLLQVRDLEARGLHGPEARQAFRMAEAEFLHRLLGRGNLRVPLDEGTKRQLSADEAGLGAEEADRRRGAIQRQRNEGFRTTEVEAFAEDISPMLDALEWFCWFTRLDDVYRSGWFLALMVLLGASLLAAIHPRMALRLDRIPYLATHFGFLLLMIGFGVSRFGSVRGRMPLTVGERSGQLIARTPEEVPAKLGFEVELTAFYAEARHKLAVQLDTGSEGADPVRTRLDARPGLDHPLGDGRYRIEVVDAADYGVAVPRVVPTEPGRGGPALQYELAGAYGEPAIGWLFAAEGDRSRFEVPGTDFSLAFFWRTPAARTAPTPGAWGHVVLTDTAGHSERLAAHVGARIQFDGKTFEVKETVGDFSQRHLPRAEQSARNPAIRFEVQGPEGPAVKRWNFAMMDFDSMHKPAFSEVRIRYHYAPEAKNPSRQVRILGEPDALEVVRFDTSGGSDATRLEPGAPLDLGIQGLSLSVREVHASAREELEVMPLSERDLRAQEAGRAKLGSRSPTLQRLFTPPGPPAVKLRITHPGGTEERWFLSGHPGAAGWSDGTLHLAFGPTPEDVREWRSLLKVGEGEQTQEHLVRVNHPMSYRGWTFYQHDANPDYPDYSGIYVVYDPGWPLVAMALLLVSFGVAGMFWVQPFLKRKPGARRTTGRTR